MGESIPDRNHAVPPRLPVAFGRGWWIATRIAYPASEDTAEGAEGFCKSVSGRGPAE